MKTNGESGSDESGSDESESDESVSEIDLGLGINGGREKSSINKWK